MLLLLFGLGPLKALVFFLDIFHRLIRLDEPADKIDDEENTD